MGLKIAVLDGHTLNPGDLSWSPIRQFGETIVYKSTPHHLTVERAKGADIVLINKAVIDAKTLTQLPKLKYISVTATGYNTVDLAAARKRNIPVTNVPGYGTDSVAQHTFALILELTNHVGMHSQSVKKGDWQQTPYWCYWKKPLTELAGKTMGIVGMGSIGRKVAEIALAFGMKVLAYTNNPRKVHSEKITFTTLEQLFSQSDIVSLHLPLTGSNKGFVNADLLAKMKPAAYLINTARGPLIHEQDLANALNNGIIAGAAMDVLSEEPPGDNPLIAAPNCIITPHNAWASLESRSRMMDILVENLKAFLNGEPVNVVNW